MMGRKTTISTTLSVEEYEKMKRTGLPWNRLIRMGYASINNKVQTQNNKRLERLEKAYDDMKTKYYDLRQREILKEVAKND